MQPIDEALVHEAMRYLDAYRGEARQKHHRSVPGLLVAELLRYIEGTMEGMTQGELELLLLSSRTARTTRLEGDNLGAQWRAYVAHRGRTPHEKREWRTWYGRYGKKEAIQHHAAADPFFIQCPPLPPLDEYEDKISPQLLERPLMKGLPQDGRPMTFHKLRDVVARWTGALMHHAIKQVTCLPDKEQARALMKALQRVQMCLSPTLDRVNAWEAANEMLASGVFLNTSREVRAQFYAAFTLITEREDKNQQALFEYWAKHFPTLLSHAL